jgi:hypothetical protein
MNVLQWRSITIVDISEAIWRVLFTIADHPIFGECICDA